MDIRFHFSETENQFFILSNLSEWHFSCRKKYNDIWKMMLGNDLERKINLEEVREIFKKQGFSFQREYIETEESKRKDFFRQKLSEKDAQKIENGISFIKTNGHLLWSEEKSKSWKTTLENEIKKPRIEELIGDLSHFYNNMPPNILDIHVFFTPTKEGSGGGANIGDNGITLEIPQEINQKNIDTILGTFLHELSHIFLRTNESIMKILTNKSMLFINTRSEILGRSLQSFLIEGAIYVTAPHGYPCNNAFKDTRSIANFLLYGVTKNKISRDMTFYNFMHHIVWSMYPITGEYFQEKKVIDELFINELINCLDFYIKKIN